LDGDFLPKGKHRDDVLAFLAIGLALLRAVDAVQADTFGVVIVRDFMVSPCGDDGWR
jgi:hypothetical protein